MIKKITEVSESIIGKSYLVPHVEMKEKSRYGIVLVPVLLPYHEDKNLGLAEYHYHYDLRFISERLFQNNYESENNKNRDGLYEIPNLKIPQDAIVDGDELEPIISAASIVAKVYRDDLICKLSERYPDYDLAQNKGYGTPKHRAAIAELGLTPSHRPLFCRKYSTKYNQNAIALKAKRPEC